MKIIYQGQEHIVLATISLNKGIDSPVNTHYLIEHPRAGANPFPRIPHATLLYTLNEEVAGNIHKFSYYLNKRWVMHLNATILPESNEQAKSYLSETY